MKDGSGKDGPGLLTFELGPDGEELEIHLDRRGLSELVRILSGLAQANGQTHDHLMTPAWGGVELSEEQQGEANRLLHEGHGAALGRGESCRPASRAASTRAAFEIRRFVTTC